LAAPLAVALPAAPAHADASVQHADPSVILWHPRNTVFADVRPFWHYDLVSGATIAYTGEAVEFDADTDNNPNTTTITGNCAMAVPLYFLDPALRRIDAHCWIQDNTTGTKYPFTDVTGSNHVTADSAQGQFVVPTKHDYALCFYVSAPDPGPSDTECHPLV
jgi:hypothetical protein